jgi:hypothetical protein
MQKQMNSEELKKSLFKNAFNFFDKENKYARFSTNTNYQTDYSVIGKDEKFSNDRRRKITLDVKNSFSYQGEKHNFICSLSFLPMAEIQQFTAHYVVFFTEASFRESELKDDISNEIIDRIKQELKNNPYFKNVTNIKTEFIKSFIYVFFDFDCIQDNNEEIDVDYFYFIDTFEKKEELKDINLENHYPVLYDRFKDFVLNSGGYEPYSRMIQVICENQHEQNSETLADIIELQITN